MGIDLTTSAGGWFECGELDPCLLWHEIDRLYRVVDLMHVGHVNLVLVDVAFEHCLRHSTIAACVVGMFLGTPVWCRPFHGCCVAATAEEDTRYGRSDLLIFILRRLSVLLHCYIAFVQWP